MTAITMNDLFSQETWRDPLAFFEQLREHQQITYLNLGKIGFWLVATDYAQTIELLKDPRLVFDRGNASEDGLSLAASGGPLALFSRNLLGVDPPDHTRLRTLVSKAFTPRMIEQLRPRIQQIADELLDTVQPRGRMDLIEDFAFPLPLNVIAEMLGIPAVEREPFRNWTQRMLAFFAAPEKSADGLAAAETFIRYIKTLLERKRNQPEEDLTSALVFAQEQGDRLSEQELITMTWLLIVAGHETTVSLLGNGVLTLLQHPEQMHLLQRDPALLPAAIEELLRYTAPVTVTGARWAREDITFHDQVIHKGEQVRIALCAANSDAQQFGDPMTLDITRQVNQHLAFSKGIHYCLGAPLARLEGQIAIGTLLQRCPRLHLACESDQITWNSVPYLRGLTALPVAF